MEAINEVIGFFQREWVNILAIVGATDIILGIVVKWTKVTWDDNLYNIAHKAILGLLQKKQ